MKWHIVKAGILAVALRAIVVVVVPATVALGTAVGLDPECAEQVGEALKRFGSSSNSPEPPIPD